MTPRHAAPTPKVRRVSHGTPDQRAHAVRLDLDVLGPEARAIAGAAWAVVERGVPGRSLMIGWDWTETWLAHYGAVVPHRFVVARHDGEPVGVALVTFDEWRRGPLRLRRAHLGTAGEPPGEGVHVERNGLLALPQHATGFAAALVGAAGQGRPWDAFLLDGFLEADAAALLRTGGRWEVEPQGALVADLAAIDEGGPAGPFSSGLRKEWRRAERIAGPFEVEWPQSADRALRILDELIDLHQARWEAEGSPGAFASSRSRGFHRELTTRLTGRGQVALMRVTGPQGLLGCRYDFIDGDRLLAYQTGWAPDVDDRVSTGRTLDLACMGAARAHGIRWWDWLAGDHWQKRRLSTGSYDLLWATRRRGAARWAAFDAARGARRLTARARRRPA